MENSLQFKYIVYITTNIVNGKIYIGVHKTETPYKFDGYLGCGSWINNPSSYNKGKYPLHAAILKYGTHNFKRNTLKVFDTEQDALDLERWLVTEDFIKMSNNYNAVVGGGMPPLLTKKVNQFDLEGNFIKTWESEESIRKYFDSKVSIRNIIKNKRNFAGYFWSDESHINVTEYKKLLRGGFIDQYDLDGNYITSFKSQNVASQQLDIDYGRLHRAIYRKTACCGYYFLKSGTDIAEIMCKKLKRTINKHPVYRYLITGEFDKEYAYTTEAVKDTPKTSGTSIKNAVTHGWTCGGYKWSYYKANNYQELENPREYTKIPEIEQYDKLGNLIKVWTNYKECKKEFPYCLDVCRGKIKSTAGYIFKYKN